MNRSYHLVYSARAGDVVAAGENARRRPGGGRASACTALLHCFSVRGFFAFLAEVLFAFLILALVFHSLASAGVLVAMSAAVEEKRGIIGKVEGTYGTDSVPTGAANPLVVKN